MNKNTLIVCIMILCAYLIVPAQNIDLELSISSNKPNPEIYTTVPLTFTLKNNGNTTASNIRVRTGVCDNNGNFSIFGYNSTIVTSSNPATATIGTYDIPFQNWDIPQLAAGQTATLDFFVFTLSEEEETILGQVMRANETDTDSSPSNLEDCNVSEDDEASFKLNEADDNNGGNENCQLSISDVVFPSTVKPGETVNVQALITNNSATTAAVPTAVNVYQFLDGGRIPYTTLIQNGATVPSLAPNGSTIVNFTLDIPNPLYRNTFFPIDGALINKGDFYLIIQEDAEGGTTSYLECNQKLEFEIDYPNIDLSITLENNQNCYGNDRIVQADLRVTNLSNITTTAPIFVNLRQPPVFINPDLNGELEYVPLLGSVYWRINGNLAPGQSVTLSRPYRLPSGSTGAFDLRANIAIEGSNIEDTNPTDNEIVSVFDFDSNCGGISSCNYDVQPWLQERLTNIQQLCNDCILSVDVFRLNNEDYIYFRADNINCNDALSILYTCDGEVFCRNGGFVGFTECRDFFESNPIYVESLFSKIEDCANGTCDYNNLSWLNTRLADNDRLCRECIGEISVYELNGSTYIAFLPDGINCADAPITIYNCAGDALCYDDGFVPFSTCQPFFNQNPQLVETLWRQSEDCGEGTCDYNNLPWLNALLANNEELCRNCTGSIDVYEVNNTTYISISTGNIDCADGGNTIYNCDGTIFCSDGAFDEPSECQAFYNQNPRLVENLWKYEDRCGQEEPVGISTRAWYDLNGNGVRDLNGGDRSIPNHAVRLEDVNGVVIASGITNSNGVTSFNRRFPPGTYRVAFDIPANSRATIKNAPQATSGLDSEINPDGKTDFFTLTAGEFVSEVGGGFELNDVEPIIDIELTGTTPATDVGIYKRFPVTFTVANNGNATATNLVINTGVCKGNSIGTGNDSSFNNDNGVVLSSPAASATLGTYSAVSRRWRIGDLAPGQTATLEINLFTLTDEERKIIAQLVVVNERDEDSMPGNWTTCTPVEDDEASVSINGSPVGGDKPDFNFLSIGYFTSYTGTLVEVTEGSTLPVRTTINIPFHGVNGTSPTPNTSYPNKTKIYLSRDQVIDAQDIVLSTLNLEIRSFANTIFREGGLGAFSIPSTTAAGVYNIIAKIDADDEVDELNENNNTLILSNISITDESCPCPQVVNPVCGSDGVTYNNSCEAECAGVTDYTPGECDDCICTQEVFPVCGSDGVTYPNPCEAECAGITEYTPGACPIETDGVDLELELVAPATYAIYTKVLFQARVTNTGTINAEGVKIDFKIPDGFVHSSNSTSTGAYDLYREEWNVGIVKAGTSEVLDLTLFALSTDEVIAYAQVTACKQEDVDSTPANGSCCVADEDDEAVATVASAFKNVGNTPALRTQNIHTDLQIKSLYPTTATNEINLFVQSKLPELNLTIYNLQGEPVLVKKYTETIGFQRFQIDVTNLPTGMYLVRFEGTAGKETVRFIKMQM